MNKENYSKIREIYTTFPKMKKLSKEEKIILLSTKGIEHPLLGMTIIKNKINSILENKNELKRLVIFFENKENKNIKNIEESLLLKNIILLNCLFSNIEELISLLENEDFRNYYRNIDYKTILIDIEKGNITRNSLLIEFR